MGHDNLNKYYETRHTGCLWVNKTRKEVKLFGETIHYNLSKNTNINNVVS